MSETAEDWENAEEAVKSPEIEPMEVPEYGRTGDGAEKVVDLEAERAAREAKKEDHAKTEQDIAEIRERVQRETPTSDDAEIKHRPQWMEDYPSGETTAPMSHSRKDAADKSLWGKLKSFLGMEKTE